MANDSQQLYIGADQAGLTLAALLRPCLAGKSWSEVRRWIETRHVQLNGELCLDPVRRVKEGDQVEVLARPAARPRDAAQLVIRHLDDHVVVVEKPSGLATVRHPTEREWTTRRKALTPTLEDLVPPLIQARRRLRVVHRLDKETSGLVVFARTVEAERELGKQFLRHSVVRRYLAIVPGSPPAQVIRSRLVRDRGDGRRGSGPLGKEAVTHVEVVERLKGHSLLACRLETGRTHQIRIHLAELGHPVCGEKVYQPEPDRSGAPRLALHAAELGFLHPVTGQALRWEMPLPADLQAYLLRLRGPLADSPPRNS